MKIWAFLLSPVLFLYPLHSKPYKSPELTAQEIYEIRGKWKIQLIELHPDVNEIEVISSRYFDRY